MFKKLAKRTGVSPRHLLVACGVAPLARWWSRDVEAPPYFAKYYLETPPKFDNSYFK